MSGILSGIANATRLATSGASKVADGITNVTNLAS